VLYSGLKYFANPQWHKMKPLPTAVCKSGSTDPDDFFSFSVDETVAKPDTNSTNMECLEDKMCS